MPAQIVLEEFHCLSSRGSTFRRGSSGIRGRWCHLTQVILVIVAIDTMHRGPGLELKSNHGRSQTLRSNRILPTEGSCSIRGRRDTCQRAMAASESGSQKELVAAKFGWRPFFLPKYSLACKVLHIGNFWSGISI